MDGKKVMVVPEAWKSIRLYQKSVSVLSKTGSLLWVVLENAKVHWNTGSVRLDVQEGLKCIMRCTGRTGKVLR